MTAQRQAIERLTRIEPRSDVAAQPVVQRQLEIGGVAMGADDFAAEQHVDVLTYLLNDARNWRFASLVDAAGVGRMLRQIDQRSAANDYDAAKSPAELGLDYGLLSILRHFRDPDHGDGDKDSKGKKTGNFPLVNPNPLAVLTADPGSLVPVADLNTDASSLNDPDPSEGRLDEALVTAIKLNSMQMPDQVKLEGVQAVDYMLNDGAGQTQYGFDPFKLPEAGIANQEAMQAWLNPQHGSYEKHVRSKKVNVGDEWATAHYSGLLDVAGISADDLHTLVDAITGYETQQRTDRGNAYEPPNLSLVNSWLAADNVATYDYPETFPGTDNASGLDGMFGPG